MMKKCIFRILVLCAAAVLICGMTACTPQDSAESSSAYSSSKTQNSSQETSSVESKIEYKEEEWRLHPQDYKLIAFTFDDGPEGDTVDENYPSVKLANLFEQYNGNATFFLIGYKLEKYAAEIPKYLLSKGNELANHSYNHANSGQMKAMSPEALRKEVLGCNDLIEQMCGVKPKFFRGGNYARCPEMWELLKEEKIPAILSYKGFSDFADGTDTPESISNYLIKTDIPDGAIMGMHSSNMNCATPDGLAIALPRLYEKGYRFCTLSELFEFRGVTYDDLPEYCYLTRISLDPMGEVDISGRILKD